MTASYFRGEGKVKSRKARKNCCFVEKSLKMTILTKKNKVRHNGGCYKTTNWQFTNCHPSARAAPLAEPFLNNEKNRLSRHYGDLSLFRHKEKPTHTFPCPPICQGLSLSIRLAFIFFPCSSSFERSSTFNYEIDLVSFSTVMDSISLCWTLGGGELWQAC